MAEQCAKGIEVLNDNMNNEYPVYTGSRPSGDKLRDLIKLAEQGYVPSSGFTFRYATVKLAHLSRMNPSTLRSILKESAWSEYGTYVKKVIKYYLEIGDISDVPAIHGTAVTLKQYQKNF